MTMTNDPRHTQEQVATITRMINAPAGGWKVTGICAGTFCGVACENYAVRIESAKLGSGA